ncbi:uncharacterized protein LOC123343644 [Mauremys mutica]|uniref:uncharacterized protein LOC123343644 n=1 Tax=Mauremys mutica TaxID=74926 RepID=UPI001D13D148|nr:uncharacterized protein LOC123343644 [Mauremys mutica]
MDMPTIPPKMCVLLPRDRTIFPLSGVGEKVLWRLEIIRFRLFGTEWDEIPKLQVPSREGCISRPFIFTTVLSCWSTFADLLCGNMGQRERWSLLDSSPTIRRKDCSYERLWLRSFWFCLAKAKKYISPPPTCNKLNFCGSKKANLPIININSLSLHSSFHPSCTEFYRHQLIKPDYTVTIITMLEMGKLMMHSRAKSLVHTHRMKFTSMQL